MGTEVAIEEFGIESLGQTLQPIGVIKSAAGYKPAITIPTEKEMAEEEARKRQAASDFYKDKPTTTTTSKGSSMSSYSQIIDAKTLQQSLIDQGLSMPHGADGQWGREGQSALRTFASQIGLQYISSSRSGANAVIVPSGLASAVISIGNLKKGLSPTADSSVLPVHVKTLSLQKLLLTLGYSMPHGADGRWGNESRTALKQAANDYKTINPVTVVSGAYPNQITILRPGQAFSILVDAAAKGVKKAQPVQQAQTVTPSTGYAAQKAAAQKMITKIRRYAQAPNWKLQEVKDFQLSDGKLSADGLYGNNARTAAAWYLGVDVNSLPKVNPTFARGTVTWTPPAAPAVVTPVKGKVLASKPLKDKRCKPGTHWNRKKKKCVKDAVAKPIPVKDDASKSGESVARKRIAADAIKYNTIDIQRLLIKGKGKSVVADGNWKPADKDAIIALSLKHKLGAFAFQPYPSDIMQPPPLKGDRVLISPPSFIPQLEKVLKGKKLVEEKKTSSKPAPKTKEKGKWKKYSAKKVQALLLALGYDIKLTGVWSTKDAATLTLATQEFKHPTPYDAVKTTNGGKALLFRSSSPNLYELLQNDLAKGRKRPKTTEPKKCDKGKHWDKKLKKCVKTKKSKKTEKAEIEAREKVEKLKKANDRLSKAMERERMNPTPETRANLQQAQQEFTQSQQEARSAIADASRSIQEDVAAQDGETEIPPEAAEAVTAATAATATAEEEPGEEKPAEIPAAPAPAGMNKGLIFATLAGVGLVAAVAMKKGKKPGLKDFFEF